MLYLLQPNTTVVVPATSAWIEVRIVSNLYEYPPLFFLRLLPVTVKSASELMVEVLSFHERSIFWVCRSVIQEGFISAASPLRHVRWGVCYYYYYCCVVQYVATSKLSTIVFVFFCYTFTTLFECTLRRFYGTW